MTPPPECLYDTLQIPLTATDAGIKKAYRVAALRNHPDKNPDNPHAEELFKRVQHAYSVLSDPHERAWYDSHRAEILRGGQPGVTDASAVSEVDLFAYFTSSAYSGFQGAEGFFQVYGGVFDRLWREEPHRGPAPTFGGAAAEWGEVRDFYREWESFSSTRSFGVADKWNLAEAPNREVRRAMEKENKRERARVKKEFNATVRELVAFVKKRDPRVVERRKAEEEDRLREEQLRKERLEARRRERAEENERVREQRDKALEEDAEGLDEILAGIELDERIERRKRRKPEPEMRDGSEGVDTDDGFDDTEEEEEEDLQQLYCAACRKPFRSAAQQADHERSKKHRAAVAKLRKELLAEEATLGNLSLGGEDVGAEGEVGDEIAEAIPVRQSCSKKKRKKKGLQPLQPSYEAEGDEEESNSSDGTAGGDMKQDSSKSDIGGSDGTQEGGGKPTKEEPEKLSKREKRKLREARRKANGEVEGYRCNTCNNPFPSRNKLMRHVETSGHALAW